MENSNDSMVDTGVLERLEQIALEENERLKKCEQRGWHDYRVATQYHPGRKVLMGCTDCPTLEERPGTAEERESYRRVFEL